MKNEDILFKEEEEDLHYFRRISDGLQKEEAHDALRRLTERYDELLQQAKFLTRVSDRLENKLETVNIELTKKNARLEKTLEALRRASVGKRAFGIIYFIVVMLFVLEEFFIEPLTILAGGLMWMGIAIKLAIALALKPAESFLERKLLDRH